MIGKYLFPRHVKSKKPSKVLRYVNYAEGDTIKDLIVRDYPFIEKWKKRLLPILENKKDFKDF